MADNSVTIEFDEDQLNRVKADMFGIKNGAKKVLNRSIAKTLGNVKADTVNRIFARVNLSKTFIRDGDTTNRYHKGIKIWHNRSTISGRVYSIGVRVPLIYFTGTKQLKSGMVKAKVLRAGALKNIPHAFITTLKSGHKGVFWRKTIYHRKWIKGYPYAAMAEKPYKLPIEQRYAPRVQDFFANKLTLQKIQGNADYRLLFNMKHELDYELDRLP